MFLNLRALANKHPDLTCVAVSHCTQASTEKWVRDLGGAWNVRLVCDVERAVYATWGLGVSAAYYGIEFSSLLFYGLWDANVCACV